MTSYFKNKQVHLEQLKFVYAWNVEKSATER